MPKLDADEAEQKIYGEGKNLNTRLTFRERLMDRFQSHEWVRVINPDNEDYFWQYLPSHSETFNYTPDPMKETYREPVEAWVLKPGQSEVILGENAYVMIDGLYKKMVAKGYLKKNGPSPKDVPGRNFNWSDGKAQEDLIDKIYLGKENPEFRSKSDAKRHEVPETPRITTPLGRLKP